ncbi:UDP-2,4-diacetamido-2,4,6-trideoxy-beta-L-altropyranose hydrolase [Fodinibius sediminis]|uniref:UDP-2,4-diacetamido-2,4,6-trideoxy-beta-L-altropyranose hydrolase n=1 Tax=Fodinibius sediminis TaxID=1214077 RepID=A0A521EUV6_9BACT|nr:UDP-2,4-diacetamido-2,4,6-trideoxy-beta-L-altropyranose hydrolase [Fodinibius sediminis]SMO87685.1 UDP-2,4-diacetamido-2,4,6-trideoxy-beta-L-altropyranose hydrolase [Fodinibius sediminis]
MEKRTIYFRADGDSEIGLGHIYRSLALAQMIEPIFNIVFVSRKISNKVKKNLSEQYDYVFQSISEEKSFYNEVNSSLEEVIVVLDGYHFNTQYQKKLKKTGVPVVSIDDIHSHHFMSDVVINHAPGMSKEDYSIEDYTKVCLGPDYALLRPEFIALTSRINTVDKLETAFICFGGSDPNNLTAKCVQVLEEFENITDAIVITGAGYKKTESNYLENLTNRLTVSHYHDVDDSLMTKLMKDSDFAIVPSSTILYEVLAARLPVITGYFIDNQRNIYKGFMETGAVLGVGNLSTKHIREGILKLTVDKSSDMVSIQEDLIDGKSPQRILKLFQQL